MELEKDKIDELLNNMGTDRERVRSAMRIDARKSSAWEDVESKTSHKIVTMRNLKVLLRVAAVFAPLIVVGLIWKLNVQKPESYLYTTTSQRDTVSLADGTTVIMNVHSELKYTQTSKTRRVELEGMAYFDVAHNDNLPFVVTADEAEVTVLGTKFTVENIEERNRICVSVDEGKVRLNVDDEHVVQLLANDIAQWRNDGHISVVRKREDDKSSWLNDYISLKDASLSEVTEKLFNHYTEINGIADNSDLDSIRVTTTFNAQSLSTVLDELTIHFGKKISLDNGYLIISN